MAIEIGNSPESWGILPGHPGQTPWSRFLDEVAEAGYSWIELGPYGYLPTDPASLRAELEKRGLKISAATFLTPQLDVPASWPELEELLVRMGELLAPSGATYLNLVDAIYSADSSSAQPPERLNGNARKQVAESLHKAADLARDRFGLEVIFHPHADTCIQYEDEIEDFLEQTDPDRVALCLDTGHHSYRGGDPIEFMRRHHDRIPYLHLKSVDGDVIRRVNAENLTMGTAIQMGVFCEPAKGSVDFKGFANVLKEVGYAGLAIVEQDTINPPIDVLLPIAKRTLAYYQAAGIV